MENENQNWQISCVITKDDYSHHQDFFDVGALAVSAFEISKTQDLRLNVIVDQRPDLDLFQEKLKQQTATLCRELKAEPIKETDWLAVSYREFPAFEWAGYYLFGAHIDVRTCPKNLIPLQIGAATAFGSGEHGTTKGCLSLFNDLLKNKRIDQSAHLLDMGCGSGILAIAAAKKMTFDHPIIGIDIDAHSVDIAKENAEINHVADRTSFLHGDGFKASILEGQCFDVIFANILASPLIEMADEMAKVSNGYIMLSGLLKTQEVDVRSAYEKAGFELLKTHPIDEWQSLLMQKKDI